ncbi:uncharacterized protein LOC108088496 isoform X2 [Drosophila ficusphila]|uniref:uncharacterized protein LOC108088496 isoform X2 n=1 Tax=Drosophila ficusphila TaxID=30025 RepID=UPI0007E71CFF|nr:uncharacterized protein LOC108088496 isoform X2 [Drosophila ficusphila]
MNFYVLCSWLLFFLAPGGCPIYSIDLATLEVPTNDFQNELTLQSMLSSELRGFRNGLNERTNLERTNLGRTNFQPEDSLQFLPMRYQQPELLKDLPKMTRSPVESDAFLGTNLFGNYRKNCFSTEDIAMMSARKDFELLVPKSFPQCLLTDSVVYMLIRYFNTVNQIVKRMSDEDTKLILQRAFYDALGGYLRYYLVPAAQVSFYAGRLKLNTMERLINIYRQCRTALNTNGNGWRTPDKNIMAKLRATKIDPVKLPKPCESREDATSCAQLDQSCLSQMPDQGQMIVPLPCLEAPDESGYLSNIYLPFSKRRIYNLRSSRSAFILVRFFQTLTNCYRFQAVCPASYNSKLLTWIRENLEAHYHDDVFYPGLGGILQIEERLVMMKKNPEEEKEQPPLDTDEDAGSPSSSGEDSRKLSRSAIHWQEAPDSEQEQSHQDEWLSGLEKVQSGSDQLEECRECDNDDTLIWCIAAFLALLLLIILLIICCCMRRGRKKKKPVVASDAEAPPPKPLIVTEPRDDKEEEKDKHEGRHRYYYSGSGRKSSSHRSVREHPFLENPELDSFTSTSSLGCQFNRKCMPLKFSRTRGEEYYVPQKAQDEVGKQVPAFRFLSDVSSPRPDFRSSNKQPMRQDQSDNPSSEEDRMEKKRQKQYSKEAKRKKVKESEGRRRKETKSSEDRKRTSEDKEQSPTERRTAKRVSIGSTSNLIPETDKESSDEPRLHRKKSKVKFESTNERLKGGSESVKDSPSWETVFSDGL